MNNAEVKPELMTCGIDDCGCYADRKFRTTCFYPGFFYNVRFGKKCCFGRTKLNDSPLVVISDSDDDLTQAPRMQRDDNSGSEPYEWI